MAIYSILSSKPHNPHYLNKYVTFIEQCQQNNVDYQGHTEKHHICPKALFPEYVCFKTNPWNKAYLTPRQHFIAHIILEKIFDSLKTKEALFFMSNGKWKTFSNYSKRYERLKLEIVEAMKGIVAVKDINGNMFRVSSDDPRLKTGELVGVQKGNMTAIDKDGNTFNISTDDSRLLSSELRGIAHGKKIVKDKDDNVFQVSVDDPRLKTKELISICSGMMTAKDRDGNTHWISTDDIRLSTGELVSTTTGETVVKDKEGNRLRVSIDDPRLKTGELVGITAGTVTVRITTASISELIRTILVIYPVNWLVLQKGFPHQTQVKYVTTMERKTFT